MILQKNGGRHSVYGIFYDHHALDRTLNILKSKNFRNSDISILMHKKYETEKHPYHEFSKAPEGATAGAATGALAGGILGWLVGAGALVIPGLGPFIAAGPIMAAIAGAGLVGTVGGVAGGLIGLGIPEHEAHKFAGYVKEGGILISIHVDDDVWESSAKKILEENGATNISTTLDKDSKDFPDNSEFSRIDFEEDFDMRRNNPHA